MNQAALSAALFENKPTMLSIRQNQKPWKSLRVVPSHQIANSKLFLFQPMELFNVHKYVLIVNSDVFRAMFSHKNTKEFRDSRIQIKDFTANCVRQMLIYMYTGKLSKEQYDEEKDAANLLKIAHKYQIKSLIDLNEKKLLDRFSKARIKP
jgi:hypothetical protein